MFSNLTDLVALSTNFPKSDKSKEKKAIVSLVMSVVSSLLVIAYSIMYFKLLCCGQDTTEPTATKSANTDETNVDQIEVNIAQTPDETKKNCLKPCMHVIFCLIILTNTISYGTSFL